MLNRVTDYYFIVFFQLQMQVLAFLSCGWNHNRGLCSWLLCGFVDLHINCVVCVCCRRRWNSLPVETRLEQSATCVLSSQTLGDTWHIVNHVPAEMSRDTALKQRTIFATWPSDSSWDWCLQIAKFRSAFCSRVAATFYDRRCLATARQSAARGLHSPHMCDADLPSAHWDHCQCLYIQDDVIEVRFACVLVYGPDVITSVTDVRVYVWGAVFIPTVTFWPVSYTHLTLPTIYSV